MYVDYKYYSTSFSSPPLIPEEEFGIIELKVSRFLDYITCNNVKVVTEQVKNAVCAASEALYEVHKLYEKYLPGIKSESTDGYSVTYADFDIGKFKGEENEAMYKAILRELAGTGLLFRGV